MMRNKKGATEDRTENPEPAVPAPLLEEVRRELGVAPGEEVRTKQLRDLVALVRDLERTGYVTVNRVPSAAVPVVSPASPLANVEQYLTEFEKLEKIGQRLYNPNGWDSFANSKLGGELGSALGTGISDWNKSRIRNGELDKETKLEQLKLQRVQIERGVAIVANGGNPNAPPPTPPQIQNGGTQRLSPESEALIRQHDERMARIERMLLERATPDHSPPATPIHQPPAAPAASLSPPERSSEPQPGTALISIKCAICQEIVQVRAANSQDVGDGFGTIHFATKHPVDHERLTKRGLEIVDAMQTVDADGKARMSGPTARRELMKLQKEIFELVPDPVKSEPSQSSLPPPPADPGGGGRTIIKEARPRARKVPSPKRTA